MSWHSCGNVTSSYCACSICKVNECHECIRAEARGAVVREIVATLRVRVPCRLDEEPTMAELADELEREFLPRKDGEG